MKIKFFRKKQQPVACQGLIGSNDCSFVAELRQLQKELDETNQRIQQLKSINADIKEIKRFLTSEPLYWLVHDSYWKCQNLDVEQIIIDIFKHVIDSDQLLKELTIICNNANLISQERKRVNDLENRITNIKQQLGIK